MISVPAPSSRHLAPLFVGVLILVGLSWMKTVLIPIALAILLTFILTPVVSLLQRRGLKRVWSVVLVMFLTIVGVGGACSALSVQVHELMQELPAHKDQIARKIRDVFGTGPGVVDNLARMMDDLRTDLKSPDPKPTLLPPVPVRIAPEKVTSMTLFPWLAWPVANIVGSVGLMLGLTASMLLMREELRNRVVRLAGRGQLTSTTRAFDEGTRRISRYLLIQVLLNAGFGLVFGIGLAAIGMPHALLWCVLAAVLRFIPYAGTWLAGALPALMSVAVFDDWSRPLLVLVFVVVCGMLVNYVLEPMLVSRSTGVSPVALIVSAAFWTWLWGPIGLVLSTPLTVCLRVLGKYVQSLKILDVLLGTDPALEPQFTFYQRLLARDEAEASELVETYLEAGSLEQLSDEILLPTLARAREDLERGDLTASDLRYIVEAVRGIVEQAVGPTGAAGAQADPPVGTPALLCCAARDHVDELALELFRLILGPTGCAVEIIGSKAVSAEVVDRALAEDPVAVFIGTVGPGGVSQCRYLCKRLRAREAKLPVVVASLGGAAGDEALSTRLLSAGASEVAFSFRDGLQRVASLLRSRLLRMAAESKQSVS